MRVALVTDGIWPYVLGGMQKHSYYICKFLAGNGISVDLYHYNNSDYDISQLEFFSAEEKKYIQSIVLQFPNSPRFPGHYLYNSFKYSELVFDAISSRLDAYNFIYCKGFSGWKIINEKFHKRISCAPVGIKFHGYEMFQKPPSFWVYLQFKVLLQYPVKMLSRRADIVFSYGGKITDLIRSIGVNNSNIVELPAGVEEELVLKDPIQLTNTKKILFLGRYERRKGIEELNQALQLYFTSHAESNITCGFIGPIPIEKQISNSRVIYHGEIRDRNRLLECIRNYDVLICPSWSEGMPNVILEAMASGLAVIATDVGATSLLVSEQNGWLLNSSHPNTIIDALEKLNNSSNQALRQKKEASLNLIRSKFTWTVLSKHLLDQLNRLAKA